MRVVIVDHYASLTHTHHTQSLLATVNFLRRNFAKIEIKMLLPLGSEIEAHQVGNPDYLKKVLLPLSHFAKARIGRPSTIFSFLTSRIVKFALGPNTHKYSAFAKKSVFLLSSNITRFFLTRKSDLILFPSACPQSLWIVQKFEEKKVNLKFHLRFTNTSEVRKPFGSVDLVTNFLKLSSSFHYVELVNSFESESLLNFYKPYLSKGSCFVSRLPNTNLKKKQSPKYSVTSEGGLTYKTNSIRVLIGGRPHDFGRLSFLEAFFDEINCLIESNALEPQLEFVVVGNEDTHTLDKNFHFKICYELYSMPFYSLVDAMDSVQICVLPYSKAIYRLNNSSMVFLLADLQIPIITGDDCSFSRDITAFNLGETFDSPRNAARKLITVMKSIDQRYFGFEAYQYAREKENLIILETFADL